MANYEKLTAFDRAYACVLAGVDEAGRGPWAGPVVAAAVVLDPKKLETLKEIDDSKKIPEKKRELLFNIVIDASLSYAICEVSETVIDKENILQATLRAMSNAVEKLTVKPALVLVDGTKCPDLPHVNCGGIHTRQGPQGQDNEELRQDVPGVRLRETQRLWYGGTHGCAS
jgi:ribonuclease HII